MQWQRQFLGGLQLALLPTQAYEGELLEGGGAKGEVGVDLLHLEDQYHIPPRPIKTLVLTPSGGLSSNCLTVTLGNGTE